MLETKGGRPIVNLTMDPLTYKQLKQISNETGFSFSRLVGMCVAQGMPTVLDQMKKLRAISVKK